MAEKNIRDISMLPNNRVALAPSVADEILHKIILLPPDSALSKSKDEFGALVTRLITGELTNGSSLLLIKGTQFANPVSPVVCVN